MTPLLFASALIVKMSEVTYVTWKAILVYAGFLSSAYIWDKVWKPTLGDRWLGIGVRVGLGLGSIS